MLRSLNRLGSARHRRHASTHVPAVRVVSHRSGANIPLPTTAISPVDPAAVSCWGEAVLDHFSESGTRRNDEANLAQLHYRARRPGLLSSFFGWWAAVSPHNELLIAPTEARVRQYAAQCFQGQEYFAECVGCEYLESVPMDSTPGEPGADREGAIPPGRSSGSRGQQFLVRGEHSFDGQTYRPFAMQHDTGAALVGMPEELLASPPGGLQLAQFQDKKVRCVGAGGVATREPVSLIIQEGEIDHT
eukprot:TRINITY_DN23122_c0_g1_i1.p1 TRINITY_DN23122_c0_g1~~TRINITY_DN23122_c0_g1_i1.p1  ORF type:complete len:246 (+),score=-4.33 TRINITY_DN23122_c0_g1_i1:62-799(+)